MIKGYNFRSSRARTYAWTTYNKPSQIVEGATTLTFSYGADRRRFKQVSSGGLTTLYVAGGLFEKRTRGTATTEVHHIQVQGRAVAVYTSLSSTTQSVRYLHGDHLGSIVLVTDEDGDVEGSRYSFDAFGRRRNGANWTDTLTTLTNPDTTRGYTGHEMLDTVDIVHMNGRIYDPFLGRVLSPDPFVQAPFDMQSFNRYSYVFNNPLSFTDPSGFLAEDDWYVFDDGEWITWEVTAVDEFGEYTTRGSTYVPNWVYEPAFSSRGGNGGGGSYGGGGASSGAQVQGDAERPLAVLTTRNSLATFDAGPTIKIEPSSTTLGLDAFRISVDYQFYTLDGTMLMNLRRELRLSLIPPVPPVVLTVGTGFGAGLDFLIDAQPPSCCNIDQDRIRWQVWIPPQPVIHQNSAGWSVIVRRPEEEDE